MFIKPFKYLLIEKYPMESIDFNVFKIKAEN